MSTAFLIWAVQRAAHHAGDYLTGEVRLCLERTLDLLRSGADAQEESSKERVQDLCKVPRQSPNGRHLIR